MTANLETLPGPELDEPVFPRVDRIFARAVRDAFKARVPAASRPRGWRRAVDLAAQRMASMISRQDMAPVLPGVYRFGVGDAVRVRCSWGGIPSRIPGVVLWGPGVLFGRVWVRVSGVGMVPASLVKEDAQ